jgi:hypothetical protein
MKGKYRGWESMIYKQQQVMPPFFFLLSSTPINAVLSAILKLHLNLRLNKDTALPLITTDTMTAPYQSLDEFMARYTTPSLPRQSNLSQPDRVLKKELNTNNASLRMM